MEMTLILFILMLGLTLYAVLGGADFGAGVWEFNTAFSADEYQRNLLYRAIGPVWETNHVWLIFVMVIMFGAFPPAFAAINDALLVPLLLALVGIVFRGAAYAFRSGRVPGNAAGNAASWQTRVWVPVFGLSSVMAPMFLGVAVGALASGELTFDEQGRYSGSRLTGWLNPLSLFAGFFTVGLCAYCTATYMIREASVDKAVDRDMVYLWQRRAGLTGLGLGLLAVIGLLLLSVMYEDLWQGMLKRGWPMVGLSVVSGVVSLWAIVRLRTNIAAIGVSLTCGSVVWGWGLAQYPELVPGVWTVESAAAPASVLRLILWSILAGSLFLVPGLVLLFQIFKSGKRFTGC